MSLVLFKLSTMCVPWLTFSHNAYDAFTTKCEKEICALSDLNLNEPAKNIFGKVIAFPNYLQLKKSLIKINLRLINNPIFTHLKYHHIQIKFQYISVQKVALFSLSHLFVSFVVVDAHHLNVKKEDTFRAAKVAQLDPGSMVVTDEVGVDHEKGSAQTQEAQIVLEEEHSKPHVTLEDDRGHFNKNQDDQPSLGGLEETPGAPQDTPESPVDMRLGDTLGRCHNFFTNLLIVYMICCEHLSNVCIVKHVI